METFALFEDATASRIVLGFLEPEDLLLKPIPLNIPDNQVVHSAQNGFYAAYQVLKGLGYVRGERYCLSYQFKGEGMTFYALGESAGLAFCLKFAQEVHFRETGRRLNRTVAATGVIGDGTERAEVRRVEGSPAASPPGELVLRSGEGYRIEYTPDAPCFLYIYQLDSQNNLAQLFPNPEATGEGNLPRTAGLTGSRRGRTGSSWTRTWAGRRSILWPPAGRPGTWRGFLRGSARPRGRRREMPIASGWWSG